MQLHCSCFKKNVRSCMRMWSTQSRKLPIHYQKVRKGALILLKLKSRVLLLFSMFYFMPWKKNTLNKYKLEFTIRFTIDCCSMLFHQNCCCCFIKIWFIIHFWHIQNIISTPIFRELHIVFVFAFFKPPPRNKTYKD